jgi:hypothetical protein
VLDRIFEIVEEGTFFHIPLIQIDPNWPCRRDLI